MPRLDVTQCEGSYLRVRVPLMVVNGGGADENNLVSYVKEQDKTSEEKARARQNIGISDEMYEFIESGVGTSLITDNVTVGVSEIGDDKILYAKDCKLEDENGIRVNGVSIGGYNDGDVISEGTKIWDVLRRILSKVIDVTSVLPKISLSSGADKKVEYGTSVTQTLSVTYTDGKFVGMEGYEYNVNAGCERGVTKFYKSGVEISAEDTSVITSNTTFSASTTYGASSVVPKKNDGTDSEVTISSGTATDSFVITAGKKIFYGNTDELITDNTEIRRLDSVWSGATTIVLPNIGIGFILVIPSERVLKTAVTGNNQYLKDDTKSEFEEYVGENGVTIEYANGDTEKYNAYLFVPATAMNTNVTITIQ